MVYIIYTLNFSNFLISEIVDISIYICVLEYLYIIVINRKINVYMYIRMNDITTNI